MRARSWCIFHYNRWKVYGDTDPQLSKVVGDDDARFRSKWLANTAGCWIWTGSILSHSGYGYFTKDRKKILAHRWAYQRYARAIPAGYQVDHLCRVILCVNPDHLEAVTQAENRRRQSQAAGAVGRECGLPDCKLPYRSNGYCNTHYLRWKRGNPIGG